MTKNQKIIKHLNEDNLRLENELQEAKCVAINMFVNMVATSSNIDKVDIFNTLGHMMFPDAGLYQKPLEQWEEEDKESVKLLMEKFIAITGASTTPTTVELFPWFEDLPLPKMVS